jgi:tRNA (cytidine32/uridine32-2'-O)-methyltransferase
MSKNIRIILVNPSHPGNVGAAARGMKTMNLTDLCLVNPKAKFPCAEATARAAGADSILETCTITDSLDEALKDSQVIIGTSARLRHLPVKMLDPRQCGERIKQDSEKNNIAILFGREHAGLTNDELQRCHYHVNIPSNPEYSSLNLAAAVQIICYEIRMAFLENKFLPEEEQHDELASDHQVQLFYQNLEHLLIDIDFLKNTNPRKLMPRLKRLFNRAQLETMEFDLLMGILTKLTSQLNK